jgi:predicted RNase H-like HicB family nuclease
MTMYVRIEHNAEGGYTASLIGWPDLIAQGGSEDDAVRLLRQTLTARLAGSKIVPLELTVERPWLQTAGVFEDDPFADELDAAIANYRRERDAADSLDAQQDHAA